MCLSHQCPAILFSPASAQDRLYYHNLPYGSEAHYNPISVILNGSFDIVQMENRSREIFNLPYGRERRTCSGILPARSR